MKKYLLFILTFILAFAITITASAAETGLYDYNGVELPTINERFDYFTETYGSAYVVIHKSTSNYTAYISSSPFEIGDDGKIYYKEAGKWQYLVSSAENWGQGTEKNCTAGQVIDSSTAIEANIIWSSHNLYNESGSLVMKGDPNFRKAPLEEIMLEVMGEQMKMKAPEIHGTMTILMVCGVGCLALLMGLPLFGKVLSRFLH